MTIKAAFSLLLLSALFVSCGKRTWGENKLPAEAVTALHTTGKVVLLSLEGDMPIDTPGTNDMFHGFQILGQTTLDGPSAATALGAFEAAIPPQRLHRGVAACFNPRHALSVTSQGHNYDFVLCYECSAMKVYRDNTNFGGAEAAGSPDVLNGLLTAAKIPLAKPPAEN